MNKLIVGMAVLVSILSQATHADIVISQYYEGTSNNKWIELFNTGPATVALTGLTLGTWSNTNAEGYKSDIAPTNAELLTGSITPGSTFLIRNPAATLPSYATADQTASSFGVAFNGNDSVALYSGAVFSTSNIIDAIGFTNTGNEGVDKSFVRTSANPGWNTTAGSDVLDFPSVWSLVTLADVNNATAGTDQRLGFSTLAFTAVPEASSFLFGGFLAGVFGAGYVGRRVWRKPAPSPVV
jgi:predicted extracellular nuclease